MNNEPPAAGLSPREIRERLLIERYLRVTGTSDKPMLRDVLRVLTHPQVLPLLRNYLAEVDREDRPVVLCGWTDPSCPGGATCGLPADHASRFHAEERDGVLWASWSGGEPPEGGDRGYLPPMLSRRAGH